MDRIENLYDVVIVGGGPAGLSAAIYMARARYKVLVMEKEKIGGQITITSEIVNYPGVEKTSGRQLTDSMKDQAEAFGAEFAMGEVLNMELTKDVKVLHTTKGIYHALGVILATGANPRKLGFKGEQEFQGRGVAYCATCDGEFFTGMEVFVIGGGFAAVEEGIFLTKYASKVTLIVREPDFTCAKTVSDGIKKEEKISVHFNTEIVEVSGNGMVSFARFINNETGEEWTYDAGKNGGFGVFVFAGYVPNTAWISEDVKRDGQGYLITDENKKTSLDGVYAAGDVCIKNLRQVVTAVSDGAVAATSLEKHVSLVHDKLKIPELERRETDLGRLKGREEGGEEYLPEKRHGKPETSSVSEHGFLTEEIKNQLIGLFAKFDRRVIVRAKLDDGSLSGEISGFLGELNGLSDKILCEPIKLGEQEREQENRQGRLVPSIELIREDGTDSGIRFHGVPGGHEFNSFVIALYNTAGSGQQIDSSLEEELKRVQKNINIKIMVSLSCTMCPELVMAAQKAASLSDYIQAEMIDLMHFPELKEAYKIMSVPCMVVNDRDVYFGKKGIEEIVEIIVNTDS